MRKRHTIWKHACTSGFSAAYNKCDKTKFRCITWPLRMRKGNLFGFICMSTEGVAEQQEGEHWRLLRSSFAAP